MSACAWATCSNWLTSLRSAGFHAVVGLLARAATVTPSRVTGGGPDRGTGGTLASAALVVCWPHRAGSARPPRITALNAPVVAMRGAIAEITERRTAGGCSRTWRITIAVAAAR